LFRMCRMFLMNQQQPTKLNHLNDKYCYQLCYNIYHQVWQLDLKRLVVFVMNRL
jgi:hypothetical protein